MGATGSKKSRKREHSLLNVIGTRHRLLTDNIFARASTHAIRAASLRAMDLTGYVVKAEGDWIVRVNKDGSRANVSKIESHPRPKILKLD